MICLASREHLWPGTSYVLVYVHVCACFANGAPSEPCINTKMQQWFADFLESAKMVDSFRALHGPTARQYSWWSMKDGSRAEGRGWRLDYAMVSEQVRPTRLV